MNVTKLIVAAGFAVATTGVAFAETGVSTTDFDNVSNVYGRAGVATVRIQGAVNTQPADVAEGGRDVATGDTKIAVTAGEKQVVEFGRS